jgi:hypothetical protein
MRKTIQIFICSLFLISCVNQEADIFSSSAAERLNSAMKDDQSTLQSSVNGWNMEYFATSASPGYNLLIKFNSSGQAIIASKSELTNNTYQTDSCLYEMIGDDGPVLTFNTFNKVLHAFSNPENPDGYGLEGDYEFVIMSKSSDQIILKGKKRETTIILNKIPTNISWTQYVTDLDAMNSLLFSANAPKLTMVIGTAYYSFSNGINHVFSILKQGGGTNVAVDAPFIVTKTGIRFQTAQEIGGVKFQTMTLSDDKSALVSVDNSNLKLFGVEDLSTYFTGNVITWEFIPTELSANTKTIYDKIIQSCTTKYNAENVKLAIKYYTTRKSFELSLSYTIGGVKTEGNIDLNISSTGKNSLSILYKGTGDINGLSYYSNMVGFSDMATLISNNFALTTNSMLNPQKIKFSKKTDTSTYFTAAYQ